MKNSKLSKESRKNANVYKPNFHKDNSCQLTQHTRKVLILTEARKIGIPLRYDTIDQ